LMAAQAGASALRPLLPSQRAVCMLAAKPVGVKSVPVRVQLEGASMRV
jgi:hypothetical protein